MWDHVWGSAREGNGESVKRLPLLQLQLEGSAAHLTRLLGDKGVVHGSPGFGDAADEHGAWGSGGGPLGIVWRWARGRGLLFEAKQGDVVWKGGKVCGEEVEEAWGGWGSRGRGGRDGDGTGKGRGRVKHPSVDDVWSWEVVLVHGMAIVGGSNPLWL
jgi:hypothetical protein